MENGRTHSSPRRPGARLRLFISYRRRFDTPSARLLKDELTRAGFEVFRDVDDIEAGEAFPETIRNAVEDCDVFLLLISPDWLKTAGSLQNSDDLVSREITAALARGVKIIPLLLGGARMPKAEELPEAIRALAFRQAIELSDNRWDYDVARLVKLVRGRDALFEKIVAALRSFLGTWPRKAAAVAAVLALCVAANFAIRYELFGRDFEGCVRRYTPDSLGGVARVETGAYDVPVVRADEYHHVVEHRYDGVQLMFRLTDSGHDVGVVFLRYVRGDDFNNGIFKVERVIEPRCADVQEYLDDAAPGGDKHSLTNWHTLRVRLGGRDYFLRPGDHGDYVGATLTLTGRN
ncbi:MAG: toll/interleukin-1 receptor domain-containing protein [Acidobacteria bacterium]|nr:toll/interleukin-1 receptor domain-containing protein [Acidobacteriota bacterium]